MASIPSIPYAAPQSIPTPVADREVPRELSMLSADLSGLEQAVQELIDRLADAMPNAAEAPSTLASNRQPPTTQIGRQISDMRVRIDLLDHATRRATASLEL